MNRRTVRIAGSIILAVAALASIIFLIRPAAIAFANPAELSAVQTNNNNLSNQLNGLKKTQAQYSQLQKIAAQLTKQFPAAANAPQVTSLVASAAADAGFDSSAVTTLTFNNPVAVTPTAAAGTGTGTTPSATPTPAPTASTGTSGVTGTNTTPTNSYVSQAIQIVLNGGNESRYATFMRSLTNYTQNGRVFTINNFSVSAGANNNGATKQLTVNLTAYLHQTLPGLQTTTTAVPGAATVPTPAATVPAE